MKTVSLELSPAEAKKESGDAMEMEAPKYPYGTCLYLDDATLKMFGITDVSAIKVGAVMSIMGNVKVVGTSKREYEGGEHQCLDLQITDLGMEGEKVPLAQRMYDAG